MQKPRNRIAIALGVGALGAGLAAAYLWRSIRAARRQAAAAHLEQFPVGLNWTFVNSEAPRAHALRYLALGDSTVQGDGAGAPTATVPYRIAEALSGIFTQVELRNIGVSGATSADVLRDQVPQIPGFAPDLITLAVGVNDAVTFKTPTVFRANMACILAAVDAQPGARAVVLAVPAVETAPLLPPALRVLVGRQVRRYNAGLPAVLRGHRAALADIYHGARAAFARDRALYARDGYHPSDAGYALWADLAAPVVARAVADL